MKGGQKYEKVGTDCFVNFVNKQPSGNVLDVNKDMHPHNTKGDKKHEYVCLLIAWLIFCLFYWCRMGNSVSVCNSIYYMHKQPGYEHIYAPQR